MNPLRPKSTTQQIKERLHFKGLELLQKPETMGYSLRVAFDVDKLSMMDVEIPRDLRWGQDNTKLLAAITLKLINYLDPSSSVESVASAVKSLSRIPHTTAPLKNASPEVRHPNYAPLAPSREESSQ